MARNVEIKAAVPDLAQLQQRIQPLATSAPVVVTQDDTFFPCSTGRLKLREFEDGAGELIFYRRADSAGPKTSFYVRTVTAEPCLAAASPSASVWRSGKSQEAAHATHDRAYAGSR